MAQWPVEEASPSGIAIVRGSVWMAGLRGERLWQVPISGDGAGEPVARFIGEFGRLRSVEQVGDWALWRTTSNRDGRGDPAPGDDRILRGRGPLRVRTCPVGERPRRGHADRGSERHPENVSKEA